RRHDDVGRELRAGAEPDARLGERLILDGDDRRAALAHGLEQVAVRYETDALLPRVVARVEVRADVVFGAELLRQPLVDERPRALRVPSAEVVEPEAHEHVLPARDAVGGARRHDAAKRVRELVLARDRKST